MFFWAFSINIDHLDGLPLSEKDKQEEQSISSELAHKPLKLPKKGLHTLLGLSAETLQKRLGEPERIDPSFYGYQWWIYGVGSEQYMQAAVLDGKVVSLYGLGKKLPTKPFEIGTDARNVYQEFSLPDSVTFAYKDTDYEFEFTEKDLMVRPLIKFNDFWVQLYIDRVDNRLMAVRYMKTKVLLQLKPYTLIYRGQPTGVLEKGKKIKPQAAKARSRQIFNISNVIRERYGEKSLSWNEKAAQAAYLHSKEMAKKDYFSHESPWQGNLGDRLHDQNLSFIAAGENIAAHYPDAPAVVAGWMNSKPHRHNLLSDLFKELGVGVYRDYYTQNFVTPMKN